MKESSAFFVIYSKGSIEMKRYTIAFRNVLALLMAFLMAFLTLPAMTVRAEGEAEELNGSVKGTITGGGASVSTLLDGKYTTYVDFYTDGEVVFTGETPISAVYVVWNKKPAEWRIEAAGTTYVRGESGFLHETVLLEEPSAEVKLAWEADFAQLCDVYLLGEGVLPNWVQQWEVPEGRADLLLLPTHADDEHLYFGGTMPYYASRGDVIIQVAYMVNHNGEPYRLHEQLNGLWTAGVKRYPIIPEFPDVYCGDLAYAEKIYGREKILAYQTELIRRFQPMVIVGHDLKGEYGHGAHILNATSLTEVIDKTADPDYFPESYQVYGGWQANKLYLHLYEENAVVMEWGEMVLPSFGGKTALEMAVAAFDCHPSQHTWYKVEADGKYDCRKFGLYFTNIGLDSKGNDFFENLEVPRIPAVVQPEPEPEAEPEPEPESEPESSSVVVPSRPEHSSEPEKIMEDAQLPAADTPRVELVYLAWGVCGVSLLVFLILLIAGHKKKR